MPLCSIAHHPHHQQTRLILEQRQDPTRFVRTHVSQRTDAVIGESVDRPPYLSHLESFQIRHTLSGSSLKKTNLRPSQRTSTNSRRDGAIVHHRSTMDHCSTTSISANSRLFRALGKGGKSPCGGQKSQ